MARVKGVKRLRDEPGFNGAIGELISGFPKDLSLQAKQYKKNYVLTGWMSEAPLLLVCCLQRSSDISKIRNRFEKDHQLESRECGLVR